MRSNAKLILRLISSILVCVVVLLAFSVSLIRVFGFEVYGVLTGSMEPEYPTGSLIYVKKIDTSKLEVGDTISFKLSENVIATHRIIEIVPDENNPAAVQYRTKGDANSVADSSLVSEGDIIGKVVFCLPQMGYFLNYVQSPTGIAMTIIVSVLLVILVFVSEMITAENDSKLFRKIRRFFVGNTAPKRQPAVNRRPNRGYDDAYHDGYRPQRSRYDDEYRSQRSRSSRYDDEYRPQRSRYDDEYRSQRSRYDDDYRPQRSRYDDEYRSQRSRTSQYDDGYRVQRSRSASGYEDEYRPSRTRSSQYDYEYSSQARRPSQRSRYDDEYVPRRSSSASTSSARSSSRSSSDYDDYGTVTRRSSSTGASQSRSTRSSATSSARVRRSDSDYR